MTDPQAVLGIPWNFIHLSKSESSRNRRRNAVGEAMLFNTMRIECLECQTTSKLLNLVLNTEQVTCRDGVNDIMSPRLQSLSLWGLVERNSRRSTARCNSWPGNTEHSAQLVLPHIYLNAVSPRCTKWAPSHSLGIKLANSKSTLFSERMKQIGVLVACRILNLESTGSIPHARCPTWLV